MEKVSKQKKNESSEKNGNNEKINKTKNMFSNVQINLSEIRKMSRVTLKSEKYPPNLHLLRNLYSINLKHFGQTKKNI